jgi:hypothetical protein
MGAREPPAARLPAMTIHGPRSARTRTTALGRGISAVRRETLLFPLAIGVIAMDVIDDHYLQPEPGTAAGTTSSAGSCRPPCSGSGLLRNRCRIER